MGISKEEAIKELQNRETVFVAYSQATKLPYVKCDEETYNDQAWIFSTEEGIKEFGKKMIEDKILLMGMRFSKKDYPRLYGTFYAIGVNTVVWVDGEDKIEIDLPDVAKQADMSKIEPAKRPLLNPTLELSGIYFMQELRRPVEKDQHGNLRELEEELIVNLKKSEYLVAMNVDPEDPKKINIPYLKNKKEEKEIRNKKKEKKNKKENIDKEKDNCDLAVADTEILTDKDIVAENVIKYLNKRTGSTFKCEKEYKELIFKWLDKGYNYEDFIRAIDNKCSDWLNTKYQSGLNPKKLFGDDFKLYTSQAPKKRTLTDISFAEIEEAIRKRKENEENGIEDTNEEIRFY